MAIDRDDVLRSDFPVARKGYDPAAVDAHLRRVAKGVDELAKAPPPARDTAGAAAAGKVQSIVEAAERSAEEIERQARADADSTREQAAAQAREHVERVESAASAMAARIDSLESALSELIGRFRGDAEAIAADLATLRTHVADVRAEEEVTVVEAVVEEEPEAIPTPAPVTPAASGQVAVEALEDEVDEANALVADMETAVADADEKDDREHAALAALRAAIDREASNGEAPVEAEAEELDTEPEPVLAAEAGETPSAPDEDVEGARLVALRLALAGKTAEEIASQLDRFHLSDPDALVSDVLQKAGR